jgi:hypothetical protein
VTNEYQVYRTPLLPYFRARFLREFARARPDFVIDFVAPGNTAYEARFQDLSTFPDFARIIDTDFDRVSQVEPPQRCPRLYVRKARLAELEKSRIPFANLAASASLPDHPVTALDDGSVFETCDDNWLLPDGQSGSATIRFLQPDSVGTVALLSTRNGADRVRLSFQLMGVSVAGGELTLTRFPRWTWQRLDRSVTADTLVIEILSSHSARSGLNEVKVYRD